MSMSPPGTLHAPFPYFGGKRRVAPVVWARFGDVPNYVEPFAGSLAVLLARPHAPRVETANDLWAFIPNFWRAIQADPAAVAAACDWPVSEADLHARHLWLTQQYEAGFRERMLNDPEYYDVQIAAWWVWGISQWIGSGWCERPEWRGRTAHGAPRGVHRKLPDISGRHGRANARGVLEVARKRPRIARGGRGSKRADDALLAWFERLQARLRHVRITCGAWRRVLGPAPTTLIGVTGVFLDPPYAPAAGVERVYAHHDEDVAVEVREWCRTHGDDPGLRIALCGYDGEHDILTEHGWSVHAWKAHGGYGVRAGGKGARNARRERIWFSPHCLARGLPLFPDQDEAAAAAEVP